ncbi:MAG: peroxiredoxin-like family protein [Kibdelosporangium sp.]
MRSREFTSVTGGTVSVPDRTRLVHLQFRRFAGCPVCNLHLQSIVRRHDEITAAGIREVVIFHSSTDELREHTAGLPFAVIADPEKQLYREFGVETGLRAVLSPRAWPVIIRAIGRTIASRQPMPSARQSNGRLGLPADFLIAPDGTVLASRRGKHIYDQWSVDELLQLAVATTGA